MVYCKVFAFLSAAVLSMGHHNQQTRLRDLYNLDSNLQLQNRLTAACCWCKIIKLQQFKSKCIFFLQNYLKLGNCSFFLHKNINCKLSLWGLLLVLHTLKLYKSSHVYRIHCFPLDKTRSCHSLWAGGAAGGTGVWFQEAL